MWVLIGIGVLAISALIAVGVFIECGIFNNTTGINDDFDKMDFV